MLNRFRKAIEPTLNWLGLAATRTGLPADAWTAMGLVLSLLSAIFYAGLAQGGGLFGGAFLLLAGLADVVDGAVARARGEVSARGSFLDSTLDRIAEVAVFAGIAVSGAVPAVAVLLALALSLLVSYTRAKGESLGIAVSGLGIGERAERILVLAALSVVGFLDYGVFAVVFLAGATFVHRLVTVSVALSRSST